MRLLKSRASAPDRCAECDGPRDGAGPMCTECAAMPLLTRIEYRYQNGEGVTPMGQWGRIEVGREFHPLAWRLGVEVRIDEPALVVMTGPWTWWAGREAS